MRLREFTQPLTEAATVGREYQHLEDLVFVKGSAGALEAADILEKLGADNGDVAIKWDGNPTIYWGREPDGEFVLVGKNGWGKNKSTSADDLSRFIQSSGKGVEEQPWRKEFGAEMAEVFEIMKSATPESFRGYVYGDLLYSPQKPFTSTKSAVEFEPNLVKYTVDAMSPLGKRMSNSKVGVVVHTRLKEFGSKSAIPFKDVQELNSNDVVVLGQTYVTHQPKVDTAEVNSIRATAKKNTQLIDGFLAPVAGLSDMKNIIYTYVNHMTRTQQLKNIENGFFDWLGASKVSANKQAKISDMNTASPNALPALFGLVKQIMSAKDHVIDQLDSADADVKATTKGEQGGEGYVALGSKTKLVPRQRWQPN
jgi:hypothetical protein|tara:strand:- start:112 stop:1212 length:1101 start_codon:yes stop_codon:yes gene_type:complete